jgi:hypothetical protein
MTPWPPCDGVKWHETVPVVKNPNRGQRDWQPKPPEAPHAGAQEFPNPERIALREGQFFEPRRQEHISSLHQGRLRVQSKSPRST